MIVWLPLAVVGGSEVKANRPVCLSVAGVMTVTGVLFASAVVWNCIDLNAVIPKQRPTADRNQVLHGCPLLCRPAQPATLADCGPLNQHRERETGQ